MQETTSRDLSELKVMLFHEGEAKLRYFLSLGRFCGLKEITACVSLSEALKQVISAKFDLIMLTHLDPAEGATQFIEEIKGLDVTADVPVLAITTDSSIKYQLHIVSKGADGVVVAPFSRDVFEDSIDKLLSRKAGTDNDSQMLAKGYHLLESGNLDEAFTILRELTTIEKYQLEAILGVFRVYLEKKKWREAEMFIKRALEIAKSTAQKIDSHLQLSLVLWNYAEFYSRRHQAPKAIKSLRTAMQLNPFHPPTVTALMRLLQKQDEVDEIVKLIKECATNFLPFSHNLGEVAACAEEMAKHFLNLNMPQQAEKIYEELVGLKHDDVNVHLEVANYYTERGQLGLLAEKFFEVVQKIKDTDLLHRTGHIFLEVQTNYMKNGKLDPPRGVNLEFFEKFTPDSILSAAQRMFQQGLLLEPDNTDCWLCILKCHCRRGADKEIEEIIKKLKTMNQEDPAAMAGIVEILLDEHKYDKAEPILKESLTRFPQELKIYQLYARYHNEQNRLYDAIGFLKRGLAIEPQNGELVLTLAEMYGSAGQRSDAMMYFEKAGQLLPNDPRVNESLKKMLGGRQAARG